MVIGIEANTPIPKRTQRTVSKHREKNATAVARLRARIASIRADSTHKLTTCLCCPNQAVLNVSFEVFRGQIEYKAKRYGPWLMRRPLVARLVFGLWHKKTGRCDD